MMRVSTRLIGALLITILLFSTAQAVDPVEPFIAAKTDTEPVLDGVLDDPTWQNAAVITGFKTWYPDFEKDMSERTEVYMAYDRENLYFAFKCYDSEPEKIKSSVNSRDNIRADDWMGINLDTFNDHQSLYCLYVNPVGIQQDSRATSDNEDMSVDVIWYSQGKIDDDGYTVEIKVPFKSLRYSDNMPVRMGVIFERSINRKSEIGTYPPLDPAQGANFLTQTNYFEMNDIREYRLFELLPGVTHSRNSDLSDGKLVSDGGDSEISLTAKYGLTSNLILDGTINPDFSQVEADAGQVDFNLRSGVYYQEKRPFFLEGRENFGIGGNGYWPPLRSIVYTRKIENPVAGFKLTGKIGQKSTISSIYARDELADYKNEGDNAHFGILRYKRAMKNDGYIGGYYTGRELDKGHNRVVGSDGMIRINPASAIAFHGFYSNNREYETDDSDDGHSIGAEYAYSTRNMILLLGGKDITNNFNTKTGYLARSGITRGYAIFTPYYYPKDNKLIRRIDPTFLLSYTRDNIYDLNETWNSLELSFLMPKRSNVSVTAVAANEVFAGKVFDRHHGSVSGSSQFSNSLFISGSFQYGKKLRFSYADPHQGKGTDASLFLNFLPTPKMHFSLSWTYTDFYDSRIDEKEYDYTIVTSRNTYQVNKYLFFRGIVEYNSFYKEVMTDLLTSFTYIPGTVIHLGYGSRYNKNYDDSGIYRERDVYIETRRGLFFKTSYLWRF
ncbi:MAG: carbohydrate binding family 9 domain-containing protein [bacterium]|nr:carbohydrate binding family 9 domain-containing protein [bacterium]